jgi:putative phosphoribosyl transferase
MFRNRSDAGKKLARHLTHLAGPATVVLGLPRGGVPVAAEVARALHAPLDVIVVRKLGVPFQPELAMGAIGEGDVRVVNTDIVHLAHVSEVEMAAVERRERQVLHERATRFRAGRARISLEGRTAVVVDDGLATGSTAIAACQVARAQGAERVVLAVPVGPPDADERIGDAVDELVCPERPSRFYAIGQFYRDFSQTTDDEVCDLLDEAARSHEGSEDAVPRDVDEEVRVLAGGIELGGRLTVPDAATGIVLFAHGSGSSRHSPRNRYVAGVLQQAGLGTLLFDLLTTREERDRRAVFDIALLAERLIGATSWLATQPAAQGRSLGYFGASTGAAAALWAAADAGSGVGAVVSRGGRPDLAAPRLEEVTAPTLLIVGSHDELVLDLNQQAQRRLRCENELAVVPGATHLFEEPGTLGQVAGLARDWFSAHLRAAAPS